jgi:hypothetical protein
MMIPASFNSRGESSTPHVRFGQFLAQLWVVAVLLNEGLVVCQGRPEELLPELLETRLDPEVVGFRQQFDQRSPLDQIVYEGAQRMLQAAIETEVEEFLLPESATARLPSRRRAGQHPVGRPLGGSCKELLPGRFRDGEDGRMLEFSFE